MICGMNLPNGLRDEIKLPWDDHNVLCMKLLAWRHRCCALPPPPPGWLAHSLVFTWHQGLSLPAVLQSGQELGCPAWRESPPPHPCQSGWLAVEAIQHLPGLEHSQRRTHRGAWRTLKGPASPGVWGMQSAALWCCADNFIRSTMLCFMSISNSKINPCCKCRKKDDQSNHCSVKDSWHDSSLWACTQNYLPCSLHLKSQYSTIIQRCLIHYCAVFGFSMCVCMTGKIWGKGCIILEESHCHFKETTQDEMGKECNLI